MSVESLTQLSKSTTDSLGSILLKENPHWNRHIKQYELPSKNIRNLNTISMALMSVVAKKKKEIKKPINNSFKVKTAALLYEITERINQLAEPKNRLNNCDKKNSHQKNKFNRILEISSRLIELSKPRVPFKENLKPSFNVSPKALNAIATPRILELSKPRIKINSKFHRKKKFYSYATCSSRIEYLSKPRLYHHNQKGKIKFSKRNNLSSQKKRKSRVSEKLKKRKDEHKKQNHIIHSNSSRSVILISRFNKSVEKSKSRENHHKSKIKKGKLTWMRKFIKNYPLSTLSNISSNHCVTS
ncbi:uncharacterized protein LOC127283779 [Leptopilina boulardi]|uniref:uncharacterized protein LOC127283779 n=1 Tax=Leptopilina boulardi TaxID=63433 RepID=UPI0021F5E721|nr:uncharacterized protein LOC127283779 [Leptopilina boulardi]